MKKFKKLLAGLLTGAMMLGSMSIPAFAAGETPVIDTTKTGSITIHKYEYNGTGGVIGTGEASDSAKVPAGAKALEGAGFTIYKVADVNALKDYYSENPTDLPSVDPYVENGKIKSAYESNKVGNEQKTAADGTAKFENLELGFYVVIETTTPDKVTTPVAPFLVSIPMTLKSGDDWLYDVHVFPKNKTTYGGVTLEKEGKNNTKLAGVTFVLQKQNGSSWTNVTTNESTGAALTLVTDSNGQINVDGLSQGTYRFIETNRGNNDGYIMDGATTYEFVVGADGKITYNGKTENNITITVKNDKPDMTKKVQKKDGTLGQDADYSIGDLVPYSITVSVPENIDKLKTFTLIDTPSNLEDKVDTVEIKENDTAISKDAYNVAKDGNGFKVTFDPTKMKAYAGKNITITYKAELLSTAKTTTEGNPNTAELEYSNKILPDSNDGSNPNTPGTPTTDKITDTATVYSFTIQVLKKAESSDGKALANVSFEVYKEVTAGTSNAITGDDAKAKGLNTTKSWLKIGDLSTDSEGKASMSGLANGTYYLVETKTNEGYNLLKGPVEVKLSITYTTTTRDEYYTDVNGVKTLVKHEVTKTEFKNGNADSDGIQIQTVVNKKGFTLPVTGGMGTVLFSVIGFALVLAGVVVITASRKKTAK